MQVMELGLDCLDLSYGRLRVADRRREAQLMASLDEQGQQDAISVVAAEGGRWLVMDGHKRVRALRRLRRDVVKAVVLEMSPAEALAAAYRADSGPGRSAIEEGWLLCRARHNSHYAESPIMPSSFVFPLRILTS